MLALIKKENPLVHAITNPISINQCANAMLAVGAKPMMAEHPAEVSEITETSRALMLNLGNITNARIKSMKISANIAKKNNIPVLLDLVGIACSGLRRKLAYKLIKSATPTVLKGNYSEIKALCFNTYKSAGVDSEKIEEKTVEKIAVSLAKKYKTIILASGKADIITDGKRIIRVKNGTEKLTEITGTGCLLGAICSCLLSVCRDINAAVYACLILGIAGELSETEKGSGSFMVSLMDKLSVLTDEDIKKWINMEVVQIEK